MKTIALGLVALLSVASPFAASCTAVLTSAPAVSSGLTTSQATIKVLTVSLVDEKVPGEPEYEVILENVSDKPVVALIGWLAVPQEYIPSLAFQFSISAAEPLLPGKCVCQRQPMPEEYQPEIPYLFGIRGSLKGGTVFTQEHLVRMDGAVPAPDAFSLVFKYGYGLEPSSELDTLEGTFTLKMASLPPQKVALRLNQAERDVIFQKIQEIKIFSYPDNFSVPLGPGGNILVTPSEKYYLQLNTGSQKKQVFWDDKIRNDNTRAKNLMSLISLIKVIISSKDAFKTLPFIAESNI